MGRSELTMGILVRIARSLSRNLQDEWHMHAHDNRPLSTTAIPVPGTAHRRLRLPRLSLARVTRRLGSPDSHEFIFGRSKGLHVRHLS